MKQITVISGKGGTGKTSLTAALSTIIRNKVIADCDVDAPDLHLLLNPKIKKTMVFHGLKLAERDVEKCIRCMKCYENCRFDAINEELDIDEDKCEGCGVCSYVCPVDAISMVDRDTGFIYTSETRFGPFVYGILKTAEEASGKLVSMVRESAITLARDKNMDMIIIDGPPGTGCPVIASLSGVDIALIVTEPTKSGIHDMERVLKVVEHFRVKPLVCINKYDLNIENSLKIEEFCKRNKIEVVGKIPFDERFTTALINGKSIVEYDAECEATRKIFDMWSRIKGRLE